MRAAQAERLRKRWARGDFAGKVKNQRKKAAARKPKLGKLRRRNRSGAAWTPNIEQSFRKL
jgi:hypothetical protein